MLAKSKTAGGGPAASSTAGAGKFPRQENRGAAVDCDSTPIEALLRECWPHLFAEPTRPLALGIHERIAEALNLDEEGCRALRKILGRHTHRSAYLQAVIAGRPRIELNGADAGAPEPRHIAHAAELLAQRAAKRSRQPPAQNPTGPKPPRPHELKVEPGRKAPIITVRKRRRIAEELR